MEFCSLLPEQLYCGSTFLYCGWHRNFSKVVKPKQRRKSYCRILTGENPWQKSGGCNTEKQKPEHVMGVNKVLHLTTEQLSLFHSFFCFTSRPGMVLSTFCSVFILDPYFLFLFFFSWLFFLPAVWADIEQNLLMADLNLLLNTLCSPRFVGCGWKAFQWLVLFKIKTEAKSLLVSQKSKAVFLCHTSMCCVAFTFN